MASFAISSNAILPCLLPMKQNPIAKSSIIINPSNWPLSSSTSSPSQTPFRVSCAINVADTKERATTLRELCEGHLPQHILQRAEEVGFVVPTDVQLEALPSLLSGHDHILHAQTGSGKTLAYLLLIYSVISVQRSVVQALIVVPTRELGIQSMEHDLDGKTCTVMALLDGGTLKRHKSWLKAEPPSLVVATMGSLCQMLDKHIFKLEAVRVLVIDEADFIFNSSKQASCVRKLLTSYSSINDRQTIFASESFRSTHIFYMIVYNRNGPSDAVHVHVNPVEPMPHVYITDMWN